LYIGISESWDDRASVRDAYSINNIIMVCNQEVIMDRKAIEGVARNAHIALSEEELDRYVKDLADTLGRFEILDDAPEEDGYGVNPTDVSNIMRDDVPSMKIDPSKLLKDMRTYDNYVRGPRLL